MNPSPSGAESTKFLPLLLWLVKGVKKVIRVVLERTPLISDCYRYWMFPKSPNAYRGVFKTFDEAKQVIPANFGHGYENAKTPITYSQEFNSTDTQVLVWLKSIFSQQTEQTSVFDFGGNVGISYYAYKNYARQNHIDLPQNLRWIICDVPTTVQRGKELMGESDRDVLSYTVNFEDAANSNILITCGTLQYIELSLAELIAQLKVKPQHILINRVPFYKGKTYITLQNIISVACPYKIQNLTEFLASLESLGYDFIDSWHVSRTCSIPFHPRRFVPAYHGFYLQLNHSRGLK